METTFSGTRSVTAIFDDAAKADRAVAWLLNIGIKEGQIRQADEKAPEQARPAASAAAPRAKRRGLFDSLVDLVFPDDEGDGSTKGKAGQGPRSVTVMDLDAATYGKVVSILNDEGKAVAWQNMALFVINVIGVYRYLIRKKPVHPGPKAA